MRDSATGPQRTARHIPPCFPSRLSLAGRLRADRAPAIAAQPAFDLALRLCDGSKPGPHHPRPFIGPASKAGHDTLMQAIRQAMASCRPRARPLPADRP